jgi:hypothetical protein
MPRFGEVVSDSVWRVPKPTSVWTVACSCVGSGALEISRNSACSADAGAAVAAIAANAKTIAVPDPFAVAFAFAVAVAVVSVERALMTRV